MKRGRGSIASASVVAVVVIGGIALLGPDSRSDSGPLDAPGSPGGVCVPEGDGLAVVGTILRNGSNTAVSVEDVRLRAADGLLLTDAVIVPTINRTAIGVWSGLPTQQNDAADENQAAWRQRVDAEGASITPGQTLNLVVVVRRQGSVDGTAAGIDIDYRDGGGGQYVHRTTEDIRVVPEGQTCNA